MAKAPRVSARIATLRKQRKIQSEVDRADAKQSSSKKKKKALATNLAERGIRVSAVAPGSTWTPLNPSDRPAEKIKQFGSKTAFNRPAQPEEVAPAYVFLASPVAGSYITGLVLPVIGGVTGAMSSQKE